MILSIEFSIICFVQAKVVWIRVLLLKEFLSSPLFTTSLPCSSYFAGEKSITSFAITLFSVLI